MIVELKHLRDFLDEDTLKFLPGSLQVESCILLQKNKGDIHDSCRMVLQVFDNTGIWIGEISEPHFIPNARQT